MMHFFMNSFSNFNFDFDRIFWILHAIESIIEHVMNIIKDIPGVG